MNELILSRKPLASSARNQLTGRVAGIAPHGAADARGLLRVTVDCGVPLDALVTSAAVKEVGVETGHEIVVTFKASAVRLY